MSDLLPCPFCGSIDVVIEENLFVYYGACMTCSSEGPGDNTRKGAELKWNTRLFCVTKENDVKLNVTPLI